MIESNTSCQYHSVNITNCKFKLLISRIENGNIFESMELNNGIKHRSDV